MALFNSPYQRALAETLGELASDFFWGYGARGAEAVEDPDLWVQGHSDEAAAQQFEQQRQERLTQLPSYEPSEQTKNIQKQFFEPVQEFAGDWWGYQKALNPNEIEAVEQYATDPRVAHTLGTAELAAPLLTRGAKTPRMPDADEFRAPLPAEFQIAGETSRIGPPVTPFGKQSGHIVPAVYYHDFLTRTEPQKAAEYINKLNMGYNMLDAGRSIPEVEEATGLKPIHVGKEIRLFQQLDESATQTTDFFDLPRDPGIQDEIDQYGKELHESRMFQTGISLLDSGMDADEMFEALPEYYRMGHSEDRFFKDPDELPEDLIEEAGERAISYKDSGSSFFEMQEDAQIAQRVALANMEDLYIEDFDVPLREVYQHGELFDVAPEMRDALVKFRRNYGSKGSATGPEYGAPEHQFTLRTNAYEQGSNRDSFRGQDDVMGTLAHEIEHGLQSDFDMPRGAPYPKLTDGSQITTYYQQMFEPGGIIDGMQSMSPHAQVDRLRGFMDVYNQMESNSPRLKQSAENAAKIFERIADLVEDGDSLLEASAHVIRSATSNYDDWTRTWGESAAELAKEVYKHGEMDDYDSEILRQGKVFHPDLMIVRDNARAAPYGGPQSFFDPVAPAEPKSPKEIITQSLMDTGMDKTPYIYGESPGALPAQKTMLLAEVGPLLQKQAIDYWGGKPMEFTPENIAQLTDNLYDEVMFAYRQRPDVAEWYANNLKGAIEYATKLYPELATDPLAKNMFLLAKAVTSNGQPVVKNTKYTRQVYEHFRDHGRFPIFGKGKEEGAMMTSFRQANHLIDEHGLEGFVEFLHTPITVGDLKKAGFVVSSENMDTQVHGSAIFGPKIGAGFFQNLNGNFDPVTFDMWWARTWGRHTGTLMQDARPQQNALRAALKASKIGTKREYGFTKADLLKVKNANMLNEFARKAFNKFSREGWVDKTPVNNAARQLKYRLNPNDDPGSGGARNVMRSVVADIKSRMEAQGIPINNAAIQALLWYVEKDMYRKLKVRGPKDEDNDYESAWRSEVIRQLGSDAG